MAMVRTAAALAIGLLCPRLVFAATIAVSAGGNLQAAIDAAQPGDTILVDPTGTFDGPFTLRAKNGALDIVIRSAAADATLPAPGQRIDPSYAALLPDIRATTAGPAMKTAAGATRWVLRFLEFLPVSSSATANLVELGAANATQSTLTTVPLHLRIDRCYLHGDAINGQRRGVALNSGATQIVDSYFKDFKAVTQDSQAIAGWNGPGPFLIENNYLEAAGENILFGGGDPRIPNLVPSDIVIRRNLITKPTAWMAQSWTVKNLVELKNAQRVLLEGNIIENNWASGQQGYSILCTPRNQGGTAPWTVVRDVIVRSNVIRHVAAAFNIAGYDDLAMSQQTENIQIRNNLIFDVSTSWATPNHPANGRLAVIGGGPRNVAFDHNTVDSDGSATIFLYGGFSRTGTAIVGFELTNNLLRDNLYGLYGDNVGKGTAALNAYAPNAIVLRNTFAGGAAGQYPTGNDFPTLSQWQGDFVNYAAHDYHLKPTSPSKHSGTDGTDLGVDFVTLEAAMNPLVRMPPIP